MPEPLGPFPTIESVSLEIFLSILSKLVYDADGRDQHYVDLDMGVFDVRLNLTEEETEVLKRLRTALVDGQAVIGPPVTMEEFLVTLTSAPHDGDDE